LNEQTAAEAQTLAKEARSVAEDAKTIVPASDEKFVTWDREERIKLAIVRYEKGMISRKRRRK